MRALQLIEDRRLETVDLPPPPPPALGEVTLRIKAVALNHIDVWGWRGMRSNPFDAPCLLCYHAVFHLFNGR